MSVSIRHGTLRTAPVDVPASRGTRWTVPFRTAEDARATQPALRSARNVLVPGRTSAEAQPRTTSSSSLLFAARAQPRQHAVESAPHGIRCTLRERNAPDEVAGWRGPFVQVVQSQSGDRAQLSTADSSRSRTPEDWYFRVLRTSSTT